MKFIPKENNAKEKIKSLFTYFTRFIRMKIIMIISYYKDDHIVYCLNKVRKIKTMNDLYQS